MTEWLNLTGVARELGCGVPLVYRAINEGQLTAYKLGRVYRVKRPDLDAYLESVKVRPGALSHLLSSRPYLVDLRDRANAS